MFKKSNRKSIVSQGIILAVILAILAGPASAADVYLVAKPVDITMPDSTVVTMWGFAEVSATDWAIPGTGTATVPGPRITVPVGDSTLNIHLRNDLPVSTSVGIAGQPKVMTPVTFTDGQGRARIQSLDVETAPGGGTHTYTWTDLQPGTYLYRSVTHQQVQVQMGLYGAMTKDDHASEAYPGVLYDVEEVLLYSEVDPALHQEIVDDGLLNGSVFPGMTSTINYNPKYFLLNGVHRPYANTGPGVLSIPVATNQNLLLRIINAGLRTVVPMLLGTNCSVIAEDGNPYPFPRDQYSVEVWAGTTRDCVTTPQAEGLFPIIERRTLGLNGMGGQIAFLNAPGAPGAVNDSYSTNEDVPLVVSAPGVLGNDDPTTVSALKVSDPSNGIVTVWGGDGSFTYTPNANYNGPDSFTYRASDGVHNSNIATVNITVNPVNDAAPVAMNDAYSVLDGATTVIAAPGLLANDTDFDGDPLTATGFDFTGTQGTVTPSSDGSFSYDPGPFIGVTTFTYMANDGLLNSAPATVTITVDPTLNQPPVAVDDIATAPRVKQNDDPQTSGIYIDVLYNDTDSDGTIDPATVVIVEQPSLGGTATPKADGTVYYLPPANFGGTETFLYTVMDDDGAVSNSAKVTVNIVSGNDDLIGDFGASGIWAFMNNSTWVMLNGMSPDSMVTGDIDGNGRDDLIVDFGAPGLWAFMNNSTWVQLHGLSPDSMTVGDIDHNGKDDVIVDFGASGIWAYMNNTTWVQLTGISPVSMTTGDIDGNGTEDLIAGFGAPGLWAYMNNTTWVQLHGLSPVSMATGDIDGDGQDDVIGDFGAPGLWAFMNNTWVMLHPFSPDSRSTGDIDGNGTEDLIVDFGAPGLWAFMNNTTWVQLHGLSPDSIATGDIDGN